MCLLILKMSKRIAWNVPFDQEFNIGDITWVVLMDFGV
jgi:hypothetical protein